ncbi:hypothetical protein GHT06_017490 [Daphnia sinensis]|uniref:Fructose-2,6-bisphosphatase TIGAR n=1 Tax=Daphnia sinensis TaxID=1820382 RepID=A0AAD5KPY1_9CRUS|nr:hypothetical protein GHT06_017490 [Daphnia sinensis]
MVEFTLFLARHGETGHNKGSVIQGQLDIPLSHNGMAQAKSLAKLLRHHEWNEVWSSDLKRSWQTANFLVSKDLTNNECDDDDVLLMNTPLALIQADVRIRERNYGICQGQSSAVLKEMAREAGVKVSNFVPPEAESPADVRGRAISFFKDLCTRQKARVGNKESKVLLVGHGGWLSEFMTYLASHVDSKSFTFRTETASRITPNTAVSSFEIRLEDDGSVSNVKCLTLHDTSHLTNHVCTDQFAV